MENSQLEEISAVWLQRSFLERFRKIGEKKLEEIKELLKNGSCAENSKEHK